MAREEKTTEEIKQIEEWIKAGNKVTICPPGQRTEGIEPGYGWGKKKKKEPATKKK